jgi:hypothetical protein
MDINKNLRGLILSGALFFAGCSTITPKAGLDMAYVPSRMDGKTYSNELMTDVSISAEIPWNKLNFELGGNSRTFMTPDLPKGMGINRQEYGIYGNVNFPINKFINITAYGSHLCFHLVDTEPLYAVKYLAYEDGGYLIEPSKNVIFGNGDITKIGIKLEAKIK